MYLVLYFSAISIESLYCFGLSCGLLVVCTHVLYIHGWMLKAQSVRLETVMSDETLGVCLCVRLCRGA